MASVPDISSNRIEKVVRNFRLRQAEVIDPHLEWRTKTPPFVTAFYEYIVQNDLLPTQSKFVEFYIERNAAELEAFAEAQIEAIKARAARAFPALIRKMHFRALAKESDFFDSVDYDPESAIASGIDAVVTYQNRQFAVRCVNRIRRERRHRREPKDDQAPIEIVVALDPNQARKLGKFLLFTKESVKWLRDECDRHLQGVERHAQPAKRDAEPARSRNGHRQPRREPDNRVEEPTRPQPPRPPDPQADASHTTGQMIDWDEEPSVPEQADDQNHSSRNGMLGRIRRLLNRGKHPHRS